MDDVKVTSISDAGDGTQIWRVTHNGVDTHPIHFHLYDVQVLNRVTWDNIIIAPDKEELGWKDTVRMAPLEDTIVALRPVVPELPWEIPNAISNLNPMDPAGSTKLFFSVDLQGNPLPTAITNQLVNYGWGYVWHCHILSHEEMDMMRPQTLALPPVAPSDLVATMKKGRLTFDSGILNEPKEFRRKVIVHELLHLSVPNHGKLFSTMLKVYNKPVELAESPTSELSQGEVSHPLG